MSFRYWRAVAAVVVVVASVACGRRDRARSDSAATTQQSDTGGVASVIEHLTRGDSARSSTTAPSDPSKSTSGDSGVTPTPPSGDRGPLRTVRIGELDLTGVGYDVGEPTAPVVVVDFSDFGCPYCRQFTMETYPKIQREYVRTGKVFFKYVPFISGNFPNVQQATRAAECAADQGKFWAMHDSLYAHQAVWKDALVPSRVFAPYLGGAEFDRTTYGGCYTRQALHPRTARANRIANELHLRVTPTFVVNQRVIEGALPLADFRRVIDDELKKAAAAKKD